MKNGQIQKVPVAKLLEEKGYDENTKQDIAYMNDLVAKKEWNQKDITEELKVTESQNEKDPKNTALCGTNQVAWKGMKNKENICQKANLVAIKYAGDDNLYYDGGELKFIEKRKWGGYNLTDALVNLWENPSIKINIIGSIGRLTKPWNKPIVIDEKEKIYRSISDYRNLNISTKNVSIRIEKK